MGAHEDDGRDVLFCVAFDAFGGEVFVGHPQRFDSHSVPVERAPMHLLATVCSLEFFFACRVRYLSHSVTHFVPDEVLGLGCRVRWIQEVLANLFAIESSFASGLPASLDLLAAISLASLGASSELPASETAVIFLERLLFLHLEHDMVPLQLDLPFLFQSP